MQFTSIKRVDTKDQLTFALPWQLNVSTNSPTRVSLCRTRNTPSDKPAAAAAFEALFVVEPCCGLRVGAEVSGGGEAPSAPPTSTSAGWPRTKAVAATRDRVPWYQG